MSYLVLARKYRPENFSDVLGQDHITRTLTQSIENERLGHAFLFSGPRGIGKTTTARLLAKAVNCADPDGAEPCNECNSCRQIQTGNDVDVMEIDGASNNSVDQIRDLRENVQYAPAQDEKKIYIIDEVHMLSRSAFNALLKTLEEPPDHVIFIFATTEVDKVPDTIRSRCQRYDFRLIPQQTIVNCLEDICEKEDIPAEKEALFLIAKFAEGSLRDAQSILDQMINFTGAGEETITQQLVSQTWGLAPYDKLVDLIESFAEKNDDEVLTTVRDHLEDGKDLMGLVADLAEMTRNCLLVKKQPEADFLTESLPEQLISRIENVAEEFNQTELNWMFEELLALHNRLQANSRFRIQLLEVGLIKIMQGRPRYNLAEIIDRLEAIESTSRDTAPGDKTNAGKSGQPQKKTKDEPKNVVSSASQQQPGGASNSESTADFQSRWENILAAVPNPVQAYLRNCCRVEHNDDELVIWFEEQWTNHVDRLKQPENRDKLTAAIEEKTGREKNVEIKITKTNTSGRAENTHEKNNENQGLLEETKEIFDVKEVTTLED